MPAARRKAWLMTNKKPNPQRVRQKFLDFQKELRAAQKSEPPLEPGPITRALRMRGNYTLLGSSVQVYERFRAALLDEYRADLSWNETALTKVLDDLIEPVLEGIKTDQVLAREFADSLSIPPSLYNIAVSVFGFEPQLQSFEFGEVRFRSGEFRSPQTIPGLIEANIAIPLHYAEVQVEAVDKVSAHARASATVEKHLRILNLLISEESPSKIRLAQQSLQIRAFQFIETHGSTPDALERNLRLRINVHPLTQVDLDRSLKQRGGTRIALLLRRNDSYSERVIASLQIAGAACTALDSYAAFLLFAVALESAVMGRSNSSEILNQLSVRVAHLIGKNRGGRRAVFAKIRHLYSLRSKIVHAGLTEIPREDLDEMHDMCVTSLLAIANRDEMQSFVNESDLDNWFADRILDYGVEQEVGDNLSPTPSR